MATYTTIQNELEKFEAIQNIEEGIFSTDSHSGGGFVPISAHGKQIGLIAINGDPNRLVILGFDKHAVFFAN